MSLARYLNVGERPVRVPIERNVGDVVENGCLRLLTQAL